MLNECKKTTFKVINTVLMTYRLRFLLILSVFVCFSCDEKTNKPNNTITKTDDVQPDLPKVIPYNLAARIRSTDDLTLLFAEIEESPILEQLTKNKGPFTVFAPSDEALEEINIINNDFLIEDVLKKYMVPGKITTVALTKKIRSNGGSYSMNTIGGTTLTAYKVGNIIYLKNIKGEKSEIGKSDIVASNGIIHVVKSPLDF